MAEAVVLPDPALYWSILERTGLTTFCLGFSSLFLHINLKQEPRVCLVPATNLTSPPPPPTLKGCLPALPAGTSFVCVFVCVFVIAVYSCFFQDTDLNDDSKELGKLSSKESCTVNYIVDDN